MSGSCALARAKLARFVSELREPSVREKATTAVKAGYVLGVKTPLRNIVGNTSWGGLRHLVLQPAEAGVDYLLSVGKSVRSGGKIKPHEVREIANALDADGVRAMMTGFKKGLAPTREAWAATKDVSIRDRLAAFVQEVSTRLDADDIARTLEYDRVKYKSSVAQTMIDGAFGVLEASDRPMFRLAFDGSVYMQSKLLGQREGLKGKALKAATAKRLENPTDEMLVRAADDANYATFKDRGALSGMATSVKRYTASGANKKIDPSLTGYSRSEAISKKRALGAANLALEVTFPFVGVPSSVAGKMAAVSPFGLLNLAKLAGKQRERARVLASAGVGAGMMAVGVSLYKQGLVTGGYPKSKTERDQWLEAGIQPYSVKINGYWVGLSTLGPVMGSQIAMAAALVDASRNAEDPSEVVAGAAAGAAQFLSQQTYLSTIGNLLDAVQGNGSPASVVVSAVPAPALIGQVNQALDVKVRDTKAPANRLLNKVPGGTFANPEKLRPSGDLPDKTAVERVASVVSPFQIRKSHDTPLLQEMRRLGVSFGLPQKTVTVARERVRLSDDEWRDFVRRAGPETIAGLNDILADPEYEAATDEERKAEMDTMVREVRDMYREQVKARLAAKRK